MATYARLRATVILAFALFAAQAGVAFGEASGPDYFSVTGVASDDVLNIRSKPSASADKIGEIPFDGNGIQNLGCEGGLTFAEWQRATEAERAASARSRWCRISYRGVEGWVAGRFLAEGRRRPGASRGSASPNPTFWGVSGQADFLNLRSGPTTDSQVLRKLLPGTVVRNHGCKDVAEQTWCEIETLNNDRIRGWGTAAYLEKPNASLRAGQGAFDATGKVPCAQFAGQPMGQCSFGVARDGGGTATVSVTRPDGLRRALFFQDGRFVSADTSQADGYPAVSSRKESDLHTIRVGHERYEIPDAAIFGS